MEFDARDQALALAALPPEPPKPAAPKTSAWSAPFRALPAGVAEVGAMLAESVKGFGQALDATGTAGAGGMFGGQTDAERAQSERTRQQIRTRGLQGGSELSRSLRNVAEGYGPDPLTASEAEQAVFWLTKGASKTVGYGLTTGPAAPLLFGLDEGLTETDRLQRQGVDDTTAGRVGMVAGGVNAAGMALPVAGATVRQTAALATLGGPALFVAQQMASREILSRADYHDIAATFDPLDPWGLALSSLPYGFGAWAMRSRMRGAPVRAPVRDQAPADGAAGVADTRPTPEPVRPVEAVPMEQTPVAAAAREATMPREAVDAAMVQHITDASQFMRVWESPPVESLASFAARTLPEVAPVRAASGPDPFLAWLRAQGGVNFADKFDITGEANAIRSNRGGVFRKAGRGIDELAQAAEAEGWLPPGTVADVDGGTPQMRDMIQRAMQGERIAPLADQFAGLEARGRAHADEMRAAEMEQRLQLLGVDPAPARGNVEVLQAYLDQHEPRLLAAALAEEAAARRSAAIDDFPTPATPPAEAPPVQVFHGTNVEFSAYDPARGGGMVHFAETPRDAQRYAEGGGGGRADLGNSEKLIFRDDGTAYEWRGSELVPIGTWADGVLQNERAVTRYQEGAARPDSLTESEAARLEQDGRAWAVPKNARVNQHTLAGARIIDTTTQQGLAEIAAMTPTNGLMQRLVDAAKRDVAKSDTGQFSTNFWSITKGARANGSSIEQGIVKALKDAGYDGIRFSDDQHKTIALFDSGLAKLDATQQSAPPAQQPQPTKATPPDVPQPAQPEPQASPQAQPQAAAQGTGPAATAAREAGAVAQALRTRADQVVIEAPDLVVGRTEDGQPITAREALERIRQEAQAGTEDTLGAADAGLLDVAVQCALSLGG